MPEPSSTSPTPARPRVLNVVGAMNRGGVAGSPALMEAIRA